MNENNNSGKNIQQQWLMPLSHSNNFHFASSPRDFSVEEIPLYQFSGEGEHLIIKIRKKGLSTWEMLDILAAYLGVRKREIGYAGLKDKHAVTIQHTSLPARYEEILQNFSHSQIKILETTRHNNKLRVGHLKGNRFWMRFKKVLGVEKEMLDSVLDWVEQNGMPNYFGIQRFGNSGTNWEEGKMIAEGTMRLRDRKKREFLISAYQSYLFNNWLSKRIEISRLLQDFKPHEVEKLLNLENGSLNGTLKQKHFFKTVDGELMMHYPYGRLYEADATEAAERLELHDSVPTGLLPGKRVKRASAAAGIVESAYDTENISEIGSRRYAWVFPQDISRRYIPESAWYEIGFNLPKGSYATVLVDFLHGKRG